jgi:hypothetical protein
MAGADPDRSPGPGAMRPLGSGSQARARTEPPDVEDPLDLFAYRLLERGIRLAELQRLNAEVADEVRAAVERARAEPRQAPPNRKGLPDHRPGRRKALQPARGSPRPKRSSARRRMHRDARVLYIGQDSAPWAARCKAPGARRSGATYQAPISESAMVGRIGAALLAARPSQLRRTHRAAMSRLVNQAANLRYMTGGVASVGGPTRVGDGLRRASAGYSAWFACAPRAGVVMLPPGGCPGPMLAAIRDSNQSCFRAHGACPRSARGGARRR